MKRPVAGTGYQVTTREIAQIGASDLHRALYVSVDPGPRYLVATDDLCPDCTTPLIILDGEIGSGVMHLFHDIGCIRARDHDEPVITASDRDRVEECRRKYLRDAFESGSGQA